MDCGPRIYLGIHQSMAPAAETDAQLAELDRWHEAGLQAPIACDADALAVLDAMLDDADVLGLTASYVAALRNVRDHLATRTEKKSHAPA